MIAVLIFCGASHGRKNLYDPILNLSALWQVQSLSLDGKSGSLRAFPVLLSTQNCLAQTTVNSTISGRQRGEKPTYSKQNGPGHCAEGSGVACQALFQTSQ